MPITGPEAAHAAFGRARALDRLDAAAAELHHRGLVAVALDRALDERADHPVFHRDEAGRAHHVGLLQAQLAAALVVALIAEGDPAQLGLARALGHDRPESEAIAKLLQHEARKHGLHRERHAVAVVVPDVGERTVAQALTVDRDLGRAQRLRARVDVAAAVVGHLGIADVVPAPRAHLDAALHGEAVHLHHAVEGLQDRGAAGGLHVLHVPRP